MTPRTTPILTTAFVLAAASLGEAGTFVTFRPQATVAGTVVTLADVADVRGDDPTTQARLNGLLLAPAPAAGGKLRLGFDAVRARLAACGADLGEIEFGGASETVVSPPDAARPPRESKPRPAKTPPVPPAPTAADRRADKPVAAPAPPRPVILATAVALPPGHVVRPADLVWRTARDSEQGAATDPAAILNKEVVRSLRADQPVSADLVRAVPLVRSGQFVTVTSRQPGIAVQRVMKARSDGAADEIIAVNTLEDRRTLMVRVTGLQEAEVVNLDPPLPTAGRQEIRHAPTALPAPQIAERMPADETPAASDGPRLLVNPVTPQSVPVPE